MQNHTTSLEDHGRQLSKTIQDVASKLSGAKGASGMFKTMISSTTASFSGSNIANLTQNLSPRRSSVQDGTPINTETLDTEAVEAALMDAALEDDPLDKNQSSTH